MRVEVYLNEGPRQFRGYEIGDELRGVADFEVDAGIEDAKEILEVVFRRYNRVDDTDPIQFNHRSLSVGDVVVLTVESGFAGYVCKSVGWEKI